MPFVDFRREPSLRDLVWFGLGLGLLGLVAAGYGHWRHWNVSLTTALALTGGVAGVVGWLSPRTLRPVYKIWMLLTAPLGFVIGYLILGIVYFGVITPFGIALRWLGRDLLQMTDRTRAETYWQPRSTAVPPERYFRQF